MGEKLFLPKEVEALAEKAQKEHRETSGKEGLIMEYLDKPIPEKWNSMNLMERRTYLNGNMRLEEGQKLIPRTSVCAMEIWVECFGGDPRYMQRRDSSEINNILMGFPEWEKEKSSGRHGPYGTQRGFRRCQQSASTNV